MQITAMIKGLQNWLDERLAKAAEGGKIFRLRCLLACGADIHAKDDYALRWTARGGHTEIVRLLLDRGADVHAYDDIALRQAAWNGHTDTVRLLLDRGADVHAEDDYALRRAARYGYTETVKLLLDRDADVVRAGGKVLIAECKKRGHTEVAELLEYHMPEQKEKRAMEKEAARKAEARRQMLEAAAKGVPPRPSDIARDREIARILRESGALRPLLNTAAKKPEPQTAQPADAASPAPAAMSAADATASAKRAL